MDRTLVDPALDPALAQLIEQVRAASADGSPLEIRGGGSKWFYGEAPRGKVLDMTPLAGISSYEPSELVVTVRAGTPLVELEAELAKAGQCLPFEPPRLGVAGTVGGMVAAGLSGPARSSVGCVRDYVLGATLLSGEGELMRFGGQVMKNVAGYDLSRLLAGSLGILGPLCEVSLKVLPVAPATATLVFSLDESTALARVNAWAGKPLPLNASAWNRGRLLLRLAGAQAAVLSAVEQLGGDLLDPTQAAAEWNELRDQRHSLFIFASDQLAAGEQLWRLSVPATTPAIALPGEQLIEWGGALRWCRTKAPAEQIRSLVAAMGGHATRYRGNDTSCGVFAPLSAPLLQIHRRLKERFDPAGIFNPGRLYAGL